MQKESISITGIDPADPDKRILGHAVCRQWRDNPKDVEVYEYADSNREAKEIIKKLPKSTRYKWFVGVYQ
jgi:hypothetical protein